MGDQSKVADLQGTRLSSSQDDRVNLLQELSRPACKTSKVKGRSAPMTVIYVATAVSSGAGRNGHVETVDGKVSLDLAYPKELGGSGAGSNPEQLVAMGYAACFSSALGVVARRRRIAAPAGEVTCTVSLHESDDEYSLSFDIVARLPGVAVEAADSLVAEAHAYCPYSKAFTHGAPARARAEI
jgi:Ohr subfamily peroxiredoxin